MNTSYLWEKLGLIIQEALQNSDISEVLVNPDQAIWVMDKMKGYLCVGSLEEHQALSFIHALAQKEHQFLNSEKPYLDAILPFQGERINITIPPISERVSFNIRKKSPLIFSLEDYEKSGVITRKQLEILIENIRQHKNILISGSPASGKTTFANAILDKIATESLAGERILILEQVPELQCRAKNSKRLLTTDKVSMNTLLWISMRNSPDRLVIGEVRDGAALDLLKAWNTGCRGGVATIHANNARMAMQRILDLAGEVTATPPHRLAAESLDIIVHVHRDMAHPSGRCVTEMIQVEDFNSEEEQFLFSNLD